MKKFCALAVLWLLVACSPESATDTHLVASQPLSIVANNSAIRDAFDNKRSNVWVEGRAEVIKLLKDDTRGSQHQRFLVKLTMRDKQTLLFAHNIDLAPRINSLQVGDTITFKGEYEYNPKGGIVHWTHHDPKGEIAGGWIQHQGKIYE